PFAAAERATRLPLLLAPSSTFFETSHPPPPVAERGRVRADVLPLLARSATAVAIPAGGPIFLVIFLSFLPPAPLTRLDRHRCPGRTTWIPPCGGRTGL